MKEWKTFYCTLECFLIIECFRFPKSKQNKTKQNTFFTKKRREMFHGAKDPNSSFKIFDPFFHNSPLLFIVEKFSVELKMTTNSQVAQP